MLGTIINCVAVFIGSILGISLGNIFSEDMKKITITSVGLLTIVIGVQMFLSYTLEETEFLVLLFTLVIGSITGITLKIEERIEKTGEWFKKKTKNTESTFVEGFVVASIIFETGPLAILGSIKDGIDQKIDLLLIKSGLDGVMSIILSASLGIGVVFSIIPIIIYQGSITLLALFLGQSLSTSIQGMISVVGGILILALGLRILEIKDIPVGNMTPSILLVIPFTVMLKGY
ncbi:MAG: DUF554 domain-containing protein [Candidatus Hodarchaeales archaeon]|jgi:uncharacterized membrane protein YqgA involved in biofilm formation